MQIVESRPAVRADCSGEDRRRAPSPLSRRLSILNDIDDEALAELEALPEQPEWVRPGGLIVADGRRPDEAIVLLDGWACRCKDFRDGRRQLLAVLIPGDMISLGGMRRRADHAARAVTRTKIARVSHARLEVAILRHPSLARAFTMASDIDEAILRSWLVNLGQRNAHERMAHLFCELVARLNDGPMPSSAHFDMPLTQQELGCALGLTTVHVNRVLRRLRDEGLLAFSGRVMDIPDLDRLRALAEFDPAYLVA